MDNENEKKPVEEPKNDELVPTKKDEPEEPPKKLPYPKAIIFIVGEEFCERFNFYGMKTILVLYLTMKLNYSPDTATVLYHSFNMVVYFTCIFGAIIADSFLGRFKTIITLSCLYVTGSVIVALGSVEPLTNPDHDTVGAMRAMTIAGLLCIAFGSGGIKPCVSAFGAEQFKVPEQAVQVARFFSVFYFAINAGSLISTTVTPLLREDVHCFGNPDCFPLAFGLPAILMFTAMIVFISGKPLYRITKTSGNMIVKVMKCVSDALSTKRKEKKTNPREHWLDYAENKHGRQLVSETKILMNILKLYLPLPIFWTLFDQQGSRWTFQATRMDGDIGLFRIKPDQIGVINPLLILLFIPLYEMLFYPFLSLLGIRRPLQKLTLGGIFAGIAFLISGFVEIELEKTYAVLPKGGESQLRIFNGMECNYKLQNIDLANDVLIKSLDMYSNVTLKVNNNINIEYKFKPETQDNEKCKELTTSLKISERMQMGYHLRNDAKNMPVLFEYVDNTEKPIRGYPLIRSLINSPDDVEIIMYANGKTHKLYKNTTQLIDSNFGKVDIKLNDKSIGTYEHRVGGVYTYLFTGTKENMAVNQITVTNPNSLSMLWILPQYIMMTLGEVMYSVTGLHFSFSQAPESMKSVLMGCWQLTIAFGNLIVIIIAEAKIFDRQQYEFFLFAGLMFVDMFIFAILAYFYRAIPMIKETTEEHLAAQAELEAEKGAMPLEEKRRRESLASLNA